MTFCKVSFRLRVHISHPWLLSLAAQLRVILKHRRLCCAKP